MCFLAFCPVGGRGGGEGCGTIGIAMYLHLWQKAKEEILTSNPGEALIPFNKEHQGLFETASSFGVRVGENQVREKG